MESVVTWEYKELINELTQGMEQAKQLRFHLCLTSPSEASDLLLKRILSSYKKSLLILWWNGTVGEAELVAGAPESSITTDGSPKTEEVNKNFEDHKEQRNTTKKRKLQPTWTEQVRVNHQNRLEGPKEDGYSWRKYGQKDILGAKYPRSYYRCTNRFVQNCMATKQVQRSHNDPTIFEITFKGTHTCNLSKNATSPQKQEPKHNNFHNHQEQHNPTLLNLKANLKVNTDDLDTKEIPAHFSFPSTFEYNDRENYYFPIPDLVDDNQMGTFSSFLYSPDISESNYFSGKRYQMNYGECSNLQHSETDIAEIISAHASTTNSPMGSMDFSIDTAELEPNFPFNNHGFFTESNFDLQ